MKVLIAGGTGFIGSHLTKTLRTQGHDVKTLSRHGDFKCDVTKPETLKNIPWDDFDCIVICVQFPNHPVENYKRGFTYENFDANGTENITSFAKNSKIKKIIYLSGAGTGKNINKPWFIAKARAEMAIMEAKKEYVILRPSWVYGPGDKSMSRFIKFVNLPFMPVIGDGQYRCAPLFIDDLVKAISLSIERSEIKNLIVEVGGPQNLSMLEIQKAVLNYKNKKRVLLKHPLWFMRLVGTIMQLFLKNPPLSPLAVGFITMDMPVDTSLIEKTFNFKPKTLIQGLSFYK
ncbi:MAG: NAD-dependent epimerase/dehydratase family protein [Oligoflexia bacterium]|nr:NAD-dependent epimerase/dehydratase family protein [Oligoflexia bacterium]